jgi:AraC-like DNA-binding protein
MTTPGPSGLSDVRFGLANEGTLRVAPAVVIPHLLAEAGLSPASILSEHGLAPDALDDPERLISAVQLGALLETCAARTGWEDFALRLGARGGLHTLGLVGELARTATTVRQAVQGLVLNLHLHDRVGVARLEVTEHNVSFGYANYRLGTPGTAHINTAAIAIAANILRELCGKRFTLGEVRLACREPRDPLPYRRFFRAPVRFNADEPLVTFAAAWLATPIARPDPRKWDELSRRFASLAATSDDDLRDKLKRLLRVVLVHAGGSEEHVARHFALHRRTLNRRLHALGTTFHALVEETRFAIARQLLDDTDMTALRIAAVLNYADASAFTRAFKRWSGTTPQRWRAHPQEAIRVPGVARSVDIGNALHGRPEAPPAAPRRAIRPRRKGESTSADRT